MFRQRVQVFVVDNREKYKRYYEDSQIIKIFSVTKVWTQIVY